jgi:hypothetical protein
MTFRRINEVLVADCPTCGGLYGDIVGHAEKCARLKTRERIVCILSIAALVVFVVAEIVYTRMYGKWSDPFIAIAVNGPVVYGLIWIASSALRGPQRRQQKEFRRLLKLTREEEALRRNRRVSSS